jgi:hypothetical protein
MFTPASWAEEDGGAAPFEHFRCARKTADLSTTQYDEKRLRPAKALFGAVALSFVIPSEAEGSAVSRTFVEMFFDRAQRSGKISGFSFGAPRTFPIAANGNRVTEPQDY